MIQKSEKGFAMVLSLVLLLAMSLMGGALILISSGDHESNNNNDKYQQTFGPVCYFLVIFPHV